MCAGRSTVFGDQLSLHHWLIYVLNGGVCSLLLPVNFTDDDDLALLGWSLLFCCFVCSPPAILLCFALLFALKMKNEGCCAQPCARQKSRLALIIINDGLA